MISFFRRALSSWIVLGLFALIMIAFIVTGIGTPGGLGNLAGGASGDTITKVGRQSLAAPEVEQRARIALQGIQQQQPEVTMPVFMAQGGLDSLVQQLTEGMAIAQWAERHDIVASKRLVDGEIASISAFHGLNGKFDETAFRQFLQDRHISERQLRDDITSTILRRQILMPASGGIQAPRSLVLPYASLMLETRKGAIGIVPTAAMPAGTPPTDAELSAWYNRNLARYTVPERRVLRYALISKDQLKQLPEVSEAEISKFYNANAAEYAPSQMRTLSQVVLPDEAAAKALAAKVKSGTSFADAAKNAGFSPTDTALGDRTQAALADLASPEVAKAAFAAPQGGITEPVKSPLGWHIVHVDAIKNAAGKPLAAVHDSIADSLRKQKVDEAIANLTGDIEDQIGEGATFDDVVKARGLQVVTTPPLLPNGTAPENPDWKAAPELQVLLKPAFEASPDDDPTVENIGNGELHALLKVDRIAPAAPTPLSKIRDRVMADLLANRASTRAQAVAKSIAAKVDGGVPFGQAIAQAGLNLPPPQPAGGRQLDLIQGGQKVPPPLALMFAMKSGQTKLLEAPDGKGWFLVHLDSITKGDASTVPGLVDSTQGEFTRMMADELQQQLSAAIAREVGVSRNPAALAQVKRDLTGAGGQ